MKIRCIIVDDEPLAIRVIENYLNRLTDFDILGKFQNGIDAFNFLQENEVDLIFLDINMPMLNGLELIQSLQEGPEIILTTAYREYAVESYEHAVLDYLVKPISFQRFLKAVHRAGKWIRLKEQPAPSPAQPAAAPTVPADPQYLFLKVDKKMVRVPIEEILYIESLKDYIRVVTEEEELIVHQAISKITDMLPQDAFLRIHRSFTVNTSRIEAVDGNQVEVRGKLLPIGRLFQQSVKDKIYSKGLIGS